MDLEVSNLARLVANEYVVHFSKIYKNILYASKFQIEANLDIEISKVLNKINFLLVSFDLFRLLKK